MSRIKQETVYTFDELNDAAKECARQWFRDGAFDYEWYDCVYEDATECLKLAGFIVDKIYFSGFSSQGDGACFEGSWSAANTKPVKAMKQHAPQDKALHEIAATMREIAKRDRTASMSVKHRGHYEHSGCTEFSIDCVKEDTEDQIIQSSREAMDWIYKQLEREYDYQNADEQVDESILANGYEFTEEGKRA